MFKNKSELLTFLLTITIIIVGSFVLMNYSTDTESDSSSNDEKPNLLSGAIVLDENSSLYDCNDDLLGVDGVVLNCSFNNR